MSKTVALAFSGGLDTRFCVLWLQDQGWDVVTYFVDTARTSDSDLSDIASEAEKLGAKDHITVRAEDRLWSDVVKPLIWSRAWRNGRYPLLCADRYLIVETGLDIAQQVSADAIAHGCTGMGNDQVRFDLSLGALSDLPVIAPVREIQKQAGNAREFEIEFLEARGHSVPSLSKVYTINENLLGVTMSGSEIDTWGAPGEGARLMTKPRAEWPDAPGRAEVTFESGEAVALDGKQMSGPELLSELNARFGAYGVGRGIYTGDTCVGLKGRIVFEAPGITALATAHAALEDATASKDQNAFKPVVAQKWSDLVYEGRYFDPLREDLEAYLVTSQRRVSGDVTLESEGGSIEAVALSSPNVLERKGALYAQSADWSAVEAEGFIKLGGQSTALWGQVGRGQS